MPGLNLTCCNNVILVDLWWNPALEDQAFDRAHRLGQTRAVNIHKLSVPNTVEERILDVCRFLQPLKRFKFDERSSISCRRKSEHLLRPRCLETR